SDPNSSMYEEEDDE
ncbi:protein NinF, partial [Escherichia coli]|nr:protein ninF [Escherichia coli]